jgi:hypothetical protein
MPQPRMHASHAAVMQQAAYRRRQEQTRHVELRNRGLPPLPPIATLPGHARWRRAIAQATCLLTMVVAEMQDYSADRSEEWQTNDRGDTHQQRIEAVQELVDALDTVWT